MECKNPHVFDNQDDIAVMDAGDAWELCVKAVKADEIDDFREVRGLS